MSLSHTPQPSAELPVEPSAERSTRATMRNPRRRARQSDDSVKNAPRRKRSKMNADTFAPLREDTQSPNGPIDDPSARAIPTLSPGPPSPPARPDVEIPLRGGRIKRPRTDALPILTETPRYTVKQLPSTPPELRHDGLQYRASLLPPAHALAVTRERAYLWDAAAHAPVHHPRVFDVPFAVQPADDVPFGALVAGGVGVEMGLLLVSAGGRVVYYDSIERAASWGVFHERAGVEGALKGVFSGERVVDVVSAGPHAGYIVTLSSGRLVQLTLRDTQGKPRITTQILRAVEPGGGGGLFGSIKELMGAGSWRKDVAVVRTRSLDTRGHFQAVSFTQRAVVEMWDLDWTGQCTFMRTVDLGELVQEECRRSEKSAGDPVVCDFAIQDLEETPAVGTEKPLSVLALIHVDPQYFVAEILLEGQTPQVLRFMPLTSYPGAPTRPPRILLPRPQHTAVVVFDDALVLLSLETPPDEPDAQLQTTFVAPPNFQEAIFLRADKGLQFLQVCDEQSKSDVASLAAFVQGSGMLRLSLPHPKSTTPEARLPARTKIEQAVFYGIVHDRGILDFARRGQPEYAADEVEEALLALSHAILASTSPLAFSPKLAMDVHLAHKAQLLSALITHVRRHHPMLPRAARWKLMWDAEKVAAARALWPMFEAHIAAVSAEKRTATAMDEACAVMQQTHAGRDVASSGSVAREFFIHGLPRVDQLLVVLWKCLVFIAQDAEKPSATKLRFVAEADELWAVALEAVMAFRTEHATDYYISTAQGLLKDQAAYADVPEFWTSTEALLQAIFGICSDSRKLLLDEFEYMPNALDALGVISQAISVLNPRLLRLLCTLYQERIHWLASRPEEKLRQAAIQLRHDYAATRRQHFSDLPNLAQADAGMRLAEQYGDFDTLAHLLLSEAQFCADELARAKLADLPPINRRLQAMEARTAVYFRRHGDAWAAAYFDIAFAKRRSGVVFPDAQRNWPGALSVYLRADPCRARLCWINDVAEDDFAGAAERLSLVARDQEDRLWSKKVQLSLSKLALWAAEEARADAGHDRLPLDDLLNLPSHDLDIVATQDALYHHIKPHACLDTTAELADVITRHAALTHDLPASHALLTTLLETLFVHQSPLDPASLIDVLTLMSAPPPPAVASPLCVLRAAAATAALPPEAITPTTALIWRRTYLRDDWHTLDTSNLPSLPNDEGGTETRRVFLAATHSYALLIAAVRAGMLGGMLEADLDPDLDPDPDVDVDADAPVLLPAACRWLATREEEFEWRWPDAEIRGGFVREFVREGERMRVAVKKDRIDDWVRMAWWDAERDEEEREAEEEGDGQDEGGEWEEVPVTPPNPRVRDLSSV